MCFISLYAAASGSNPFHLPAGAAQTGMGSVCTVKPGFWSSFRNQALISSFPSAAAGFNYEDRFNISELGSRSAAIIIPAGRTSLGLICSHFGFSHFKRVSAGIACGLTLSEKMSAGIQIDYFHEKASGEYNIFQTVTFEGGLTVSASDNILLAMHLFNPVPNSLRKTLMPSTITAGAGLKISQGLFTAIEAVLSTSSGMILKTGVEYSANEKFTLRGGFCSENSAFTFGLGYSFRSIVLDISFASHEKLGITTNMSVIFNIKAGN